MKKNLILLSVQLLFCSIGHAQIYNIVDFGASVDSTILNTNAIQSAIDRCHQLGGGEVVVPPGKYYTGTIFLKSNVYLKLSAGATLQGSYNPLDYPEHNILSAKKFGTISHSGLHVDYMKTLVIADNAHHTGIIGQGTLKGAGEGSAFQLGLNKDGKPKNIFFINCKDVVISDIDILNSAQVTISISGCERVVIDGIYVKSLANWNCDGLDIDGKDVIVSNSIIDSEDDALCLKSEYHGKFCENVTISNCIFSSLCNGIKLGTGSRTGFRNITINNCVIKKSSLNGYRHWRMTPEYVHDPEIQSVNTGIVILSVDGGIIDNVKISNIIMTDVLSPIFVRTGKRFLSLENKPSVIRNVSISGVRAHTRSIIPSIIAGLEESPVEEIRLSDIQINIPISVDESFVKTFPSIVPEDTKGYPENRLTFGLKIPASGFYLRHVNGVTMRDISITHSHSDARAAFFLDDVSGVRLGNVFIDGKKMTKDEHLILKTPAENGEVVIE